MKIIKIIPPTKKDKTMHGPPKVKNTNNIINITSKDLFKGPTNGKDKDKIMDIQGRSFKEYTYTNFTNIILNTKNIWAIYRFGESDWNLLVKDKRRYEGYVCGYLEYYDSEARNGMIDHGVFFHWGKWDGDKFCCVIFLDPAPITKTIKYSNTSDRFGNKFFGQIALVDSPISKASDPPRVPPPPPPY